MLTRSDIRASGVRRIAEQLAEHLQADLALKLWDGSVVPLGKDVRGDLAFVIRSPAAVRRLMFSPRLTTFFELFASGELDVEGGTFLDAIRRLDHLKAIGIRQSLDKRLLLKSLWPFLFTRSAADPQAALAYKDPVGERADKGRDDRKLVQFHYDVSNTFYALFLGPEMVYSCAYFPRPDMDLDEAQRAKLDMICRRLRLKPGERFLDIGCGWGGLICHAARNYGVKALGVTLSQQQFDFAKERIKQLGLEGRVAIELRDYRTVEAKPPFDKIAQIELFEHIGVENHDQHFETIHKLLRPRGLYLHHSVTRRLTRNPNKAKKTAAYQNFLGSFVLPGTALDSIGGTLSKLERHGFEVHDVENWREHFQRTSELWAARLQERREEAEARVGYVKTRLWLLFFWLFALAFERNACLIFQTLASRRGVGESGLPPTRADLYS